MASALLHRVERPRALNRPKELAVAKAVQWVRAGSDPLAPEDAPAKQTVRLIRSQLPLKQPSAVAARRSRGGSAASLASARGPGHLPSVMAAPR